MTMLLVIALKSLVVAALTLGALALMKQRSAAIRSWVAHLGLVALLVVAFAPLVMPSWTVETPALTADATTQVATSTDSIAARKIRVAPNAVYVPADADPKARPLISTTIASAILYAIPAVVLLALTLLALFRLVALRARADVLVDAHWLSALARAQRRMGFKHGTALLTSDALASPISWGMMRPVILLNPRAVEASGDAEAIIAHELAHVARMDWVKLLLARVATALFWFNPLVWILAREAHQLREEAADDLVLAADIDDTDYAQLLVGVARHECPGLLLGAHGVAPSRHSLSRRVARVLDRALERTPARRPFALGMVAGAGMMAVPLAALTLVPVGTVESAKAADPARAARNAYVASEPSDLGSIIAAGVTASVMTAKDALDPEAAADIRLSANPSIVVEGAAAKAIEKAREAEAWADAKVEARADADNLIRIADHRAKALGITPEYRAAIRQALPTMSNETSDLAQMKAVGVTPDYARAMAMSGLRNVDADALTEARAVGVSSDYARSMIQIGAARTMDDIVEMRALGVTVDFARRMRATNPRYEVDDIVEAWLVGGAPKVRIARPKTTTRTSPPAPPEPFEPPPLPDPGGT